MIITHFGDSWSCNNRCWDEWITPKNYVVAFHWDCSRHAYPDEWKDNDYPMICGRCYKRKRDENRLVYKMFGRREL